MTAFSSGRVMISSKGTPNTPLASIIAASPTEKKNSNKQNLARTAKASRCISAISYKGMLCVHLYTGLAQSSKVLHNICSHCSPCQ